MTAPEGSSTQEPTPNCLSQSENDICFSPVVNDGTGIDCCESVVGGGIVCLGLQVCCLRSEMDNSMTMPTAHSKANARSILLYWVQCMIVFLYLSI